MRYPSTLIGSDLIAPLSRAQEELLQIRVKCDSQIDEALELKGLFVMGLAVFETGISDTYLYYLKHRPEVLPMQKIEVEREEALKGGLTLELWRHKAKKRVRRVMYRSLEKQIDLFASDLGISLREAVCNSLSMLVEAKETRNSLMHNGLIATEDYLRKSGDMKRASRVGERLSLSSEYARDSLSACAAVTRSLTNSVQEKYGEYTRIRALRQIWDYLFDSPLLEFDDYWIIDEMEDRLVGMKRHPAEEQLSSSEKMFLTAWRYHFNRWDEDAVLPFMRGLDRQHQRNMLWFLFVLSEFSLS